MGKSKKELKAELKRANKQLKSVWEKYDAMEAECDVWREQNERLKYRIITMENTIRDFNESVQVSARVQFPIGAKSVTAGTIPSIELYSDTGINDG